VRRRNCDPLWLLGTVFHFPVTWVYPGSQVWRILMLSLLLYLCPLSFNYRRLCSVSRYISSMGLLPLWCFSIACPLCILCSQIIIARFSLSAPHKPFNVSLVASSEDSSYTVLHCSSTGVRNLRVDSTLFSLLLSKNESRLFEIPSLCALLSVFVSSLITFEPNSEFSLNCVGRWCHWRWPWRHIFNLVHSTVPKWWTCKLLRWMQWKCAVLSRIYCFVLMFCVFD
jgi:hypothetical protein